MRPFPSRRVFLAGMMAAPLAHAARSTVRINPPPISRIPDELVKLAGTCVMSGFYGSRVGGGLAELLRRGAIGGILLARQNSGSMRDLQATCASIKAMAPPDAEPLVTADQEGGPVMHLTPPMRPCPSLTALGTIDDELLTHRAGAALGAECREAGLNINLGPVLDVRTSPRNSVVLNRTFGRDPAKAARHGQRFIDGMNSAGMLTCGKHFPGHGDTQTDSHSTLPHVAHDITRLEEVELVSFRACAPKLNAMMVAHVVYRGVDPENPASLSKRVIEGILRDRMGFAGMSMTDDLEMAAIRNGHPVEHAMELAMRAGADMLLVAHTVSIAIRGIAHLASTAEHDTELRARLEVAAGRVRALRAQMHPILPPNPYRVDAGNLMREVASRLAAQAASRSRASNNR